MTNKWIFSLAFALALPLGIIGACESETSNVVGDTTSGTGGASSGAGGQGGDGAGSSTGGNGTGGSTSSGTGGLPLPTEVSECQGHIYECGDLLDNDFDNLVDYQDGECLGPCDDTEDSFFGGIPGSAGPKCDVDCYFDQDSGHGNDQCYWDHRCDPLSIAPNYYPEPKEDDGCAYLGPDHEVTPVHETCDTLLNANGQSQDCLDYCLPLTPNGCDCFGCCELPAESGLFVWLGSEGIDGTTFCTTAELANPDICHPCTPVTDCFNECGHCELCVGKTVLPPDCFNPDGGPPPDQCDPGVQPCGVPGQDPCPPGYYCITGCCVAPPQ